MYVFQTDLGPSPAPSLHRYVGGVDGNCRKPPGVRNPRSSPHRREKYRRTNTHTKLPPNSLNTGKFIQAGIDVSNRLNVDSSTGNEKVERSRWHGLRNLSVLFFIPSLLLPGITFVAPNVFAFALLLHFSFVLRNDLGIHRT